MSNAVPRRSLTATALSALLLVAVSTGGVSAQTMGTLPGGTPITVDNTIPADGAEFNVPGTTIDVVDAGQATIGAGVPITLAYALDTSGSMTLDAGVDCDGVPGTDTRLVCAQFGIATAQGTAADPLSPIELSGLASFADAGATHDVNFGVGGTQLLVTPGFDGNAANGPDLEEAAFALTAPLGGQTNFAAGLSASFDVINDASNTNTSNIILFLSDADTGSVMVGPHINTVAASVPAGTTIHAFGMGAGTSCTFDGGTGTLNEIAALSTAGVGTCTVVTDVSQIDDEISKALGSTLESLEIQLDGGAFSPIPAADIDIALPANGNFLEKTANYSTVVEDLGVGDHTICVRATGTDAGGTGSVTDCKTIHLLKLTLEPATAENELGSDNQHTVTATLLGDPAYVAANPRVVDFTVGGQNAGATGVCSPNLDCSTDANGVVNFTYTVPIAPASLGTDTIEACTEIGGGPVCLEVEKTWVDTTPPTSSCVETTNPSGAHVPPAGPSAGNSGQNPDGFYLLSGEDDVWPAEDLQIFVYDSASPAVFGPYPVGTKIKLTQAPGATPVELPGPGDIDVHLILKGDALVTAVDGSGNESDPVLCTVAPPPKG